MCLNSSRLLKSLWTPGIGIQNHLSGQLPWIRSWRNCNGAGKPSKTSSRGAPCRVHEKGGKNNSSRLGDTTLDSLLHSDSGDSVSRVMKTLAPSWYLELSPAQHEDSSLVRLVDARAVSQERLKRELIALLQEISKLKPLLLFFEDVHWSDVSTVDLLAYIAAHFESLHVLVAVTYRPAEMVQSKHPLLQLELDLQSRGLCREIRLDFLGQTDVEKFLTLEFPANKFPREFVQFIWEKTEGNPLFM